MNERLLQYIWQFQYFNQSSLCTGNGEPLQIIHPGNYNSNQGPDFSEAKIKVSDTTWAGNIELHVKSSDWRKHKHNTDCNYKNVILHVVWQHDTEESLAFPTLVLEDKIPKLLLRRYDELMNQSIFIPCEKTIADTDELIWTSWKERLLVERLQFRSGLVLRFLEQNNYHWEETFWWMIARNFGISQNSDAFEKIARSIPLKILGRHKNQLQQVEALLMGQGGLLEIEFSEKYPVMLQKEYRFLQHKYRLKPVQHPLYFLRMRPANFPGIRLAQLAVLIHNSQQFFAQVCEIDSLQSIKKLLDITANDYWHYHYVFDEISGFKEKKLGAQMVENIIINTIVPILFCFGRYYKKEQQSEKAIQWLGMLSAENNNIIKGFRSLQIAAADAFDSQALIQLKNEYCNKKRCLDCAIGNKLLRGK
ncbi:MAG: DUF2851 family protein [Ferruginibacter sp.]